jgi:hypothetical protein
LLKRIEGPERVKPEPYVYGRFVIFWINLLYS